MAVSLEEIQKNTQDDIQAGVIDEFRKSSYLFQALTFDDAVTPGTQDGTLTYGYTRVTTQPTAASRDFNEEYEAQEAKKTRYTVDLKVFGGAFKIDRVFNDVGGLVSELQFQTEQKVKATRSKFHDLAINGDSGAEATEFDGLDAALTESSTEHNAESSRDWTGVETQKAAFLELEQIDEWLALLDEKPGAILGNSKSLARLRALARWAGYLSQTEDAFGRKVDAYDGIPLIDLGDKPGASTPIIATETREIGEEEIENLTDLYAVRFGMDAFHGVTLAGGTDSGLVRTYLDEFLPDYRASGAVRQGDVEMVTAVALRATKAAGVFRNIKVA